jgi:hypothetical protein
MSKIYQLLDEMEELYKNNPRQRSSTGIVFSNKFARNRMTEVARLFGWELDNLNDDELVLAMKTRKELVKSFN